MNDEDVDQTNSRLGRRTTSMIPIWLQIHLWVYNNQYMYKWSDPRYNTVRLGVILGTILSGLE